MSIYLFNGNMLLLKIYKSCFSVLYKSENSYYLKKY